MRLFQIVERALAQGTLPETEPTSPVPERWESVAAILSGAINLTFAVGIGICLVFMTVGGIKYATSGGDQKAAESARNTITSAVIGFVVILAFRLVLELIMKLLGVTTIPLFPTF